MNDCKSAATFVSKIWKKYHDVKPSEVADTAEKVVNQWNKLFENCGLTIGPRVLVRNKELEGNVVLGTERYFITPRPTEKPARLRFTKCSGKAEGELTLRAFKSNGSNTEIASFKLRADMPEREVIDEEIPPGVILVLHVDSTTPHREIKYKVKLVVG